MRVGLEGLARPRNTVGYPLPDVEIRFHGGEDENQGVLHTRNPGVMLGYHNLPDETARCLEDGWLDTGDILRRDADGWFYFIGRADDMFVTGGGQNQTGWSNARYDQMIEQAAVEPDPQRRFELLTEAERLLMTELPIIPIYYYVSINMVQTNVKGFHANLLDKHPLHILEVF